MESSTAVMGSARRSRKIGSACMPTEVVCLLQGILPHDLIPHQGPWAYAQGTHLCGSSIAQHQRHQQEVWVLQDLQK